MEWLLLLMVLTIFAALMSGFPVAFVLAGVSLLFAGLGTLLGMFDHGLMSAMPNRLFGIMLNQTLVAVPLFVLMGVILERSRVAEELLDNMSRLLGGLRGGLALSVILVGMLLAASTGIVGATVVTMGLLSLPIMQRAGYSPAVATGTICATGTLGQIIPPSIALVLLGDIISSAYQQAQLSMNVFNPKTVSVGDLFIGAIIPGMLLVALYAVFILVLAWLRPGLMPAAERQNVDLWSLIKGLLPPLILIAVVLGSILAGAATPTEAAGVGAFGAWLLASMKREMGLTRLREVMRSTLKITAMVFMILLGAAVFSLVFRGFGGEELIHRFLSDMPGGVFGATLMVMLIIFLLGFILDFIEITFVVVPIVGPILLTMGVDPVWLGIMIAINLQTSFLTPPFGFALFYLRGVADDAIPTLSIYRGVIPFIVIQLLVIALLWRWPQLATWLPEQLNP